MDVRSVADTIGGEHGRKDSAVAGPGRDASSQLAQHHRFIRGAHSDRGTNGDLELARTVFGQKGLRRHTSRSQRRHEARTETSPARGMTSTRRHALAPAGRRYKQTPARNSQGLGSRSFSRGAEVRGAESCAGSTATHRRLSSRMSARQKCSGAAFSAGTSAGMQTSVEGSGIRTISPVVPKGVGPMAPKTEMQMLAGVYPTPWQHVIGEIAGGNRFAADLRRKIADADEDQILRRVIVTE